MKQATFSWKLTHLDQTHVNCGGATSSASIWGMNDVIENIFLNDNSISRHKLQAAVMASTGATLSLRSIQVDRGNHKGYEAVLYSTSRVRILVYVDSIEIVSHAAVVVY